MPDNVIDRFDALVDALDRLVALYRSPPSAEDWAKAIEQAEQALPHAPAIRERLAAFVSPRTKAEVAALDKEIAAKMGAERLRLQFQKRDMDVADIMDLLWPYLTRLVADPG